VYLKGNVAHGPTAGLSGELVRAIDALDAYTPTAWWAVHRARHRAAPRRGFAEIWIFLAGTIAVPWPLPDRPPVI
jgi:hypothetical protein